MNRVVESRHSPPHTAPHLGIAIYFDGTHIGILHRVDDAKGVLLLHLGWHEKLSLDPPDASDYVLWVRPNIPPERAMVVAAFCRRVWDQNGRRVPYGFSDPRGFFGTDGKVLKGPAKVGLTCATFVLAVFHETGLPLIDYGSWPGPDEDDIEWQEEISKRLDENVASGRLPESHAQSVRSELGNVRYRPLQVAGAGACDNLPVEHSLATEMSDRIEEKLTLLKESSESL